MAILFHLNILSDMINRFKLMKTFYISTLRNHWQSVPGDVHNQMEIVHNVWNPISVSYTFFFQWKTNWDFFVNFDFLITFSLQTLDISNNEFCEMFSLIYQRFALLSCKDVGIRNVSVWKILNSFKHKP